MSVPPSRRSTPVISRFSPVLGWGTTLQFLVRRETESTTFSVPDSNALWSRSDDDLLIQDVPKYSTSDVLPPPHLVQTNIRYNNFFHILNQTECVERSSLTESGSSDSSTSSSTSSSVSSSSSSLSCHTGLTSADVNLTSGTRSPDETDGTAGSVTRGVAKRCSLIVVCL